MPEITLFTHSNGLLTKQFALDQQGKLIKTASAQFSAGTAQTLTTSDLRELVTLHSSLSFNQAITYGVIKGKPKEVCVRTQANAKDGCIARSRKFMDWDQGPGFVTIDIDPDGMPEKMQNRLRLHDWLGGFLHEAMPELKGIGMYWCASSGRLFNFLSNSHLTFTQFSCPVSGRADGVRAWSARGARGPTARHQWCAPMPSPRG